MDKPTWENLLADAAEHYGDVFRRSLVDLDRQGSSWTHEEVGNMLTHLGERIWLSWDALPPKAGRQ